MIEKFSNKVTKALYSNHADPVGLVNDKERSVLTRFLAREYDDLEHTIRLYDTSRMFWFHHRFLLLVPSSQNGPATHLSFFVLSILIFKIRNILTLQPSAHFIFAQLVCIFDFTYSSLLRRR